MGSAEVPQGGTRSRRSGIPHCPQSGLALTTLVASAAATAATTRAATRSAHHQPKRWSVNKPTKARIPRADPKALSVPSPIKAWLFSRCPVRYLAHPRGARTTAETPAAIMASTVGPGAVCVIRSMMAATTRVIATRPSAPATTTDARASARMPRVGSRRSTPKRHTRPIDPATSAQTLSPSPRTPRLPASNPVVTAQAPAIRPHTTERYESTRALDNSRDLVWPTSSSKESIKGQSCGPGERWSLPGAT
jgi:hypothetical protein